MSRPGLVGRFDAPRGSDEAVCMTDIHDVTTAVGDLEQALTAWWDLPMERRDARFQEVVEQAQTTRAVLDGFLPRRAAP